MEDLSEKQGRFGRLVFARWRHIIEQDGRAVRDERQTVVYRQAPSVLRDAVNDDGRGTGTGETVPETIGSRRRSLVFDTAMLFGFSAVTWNSHRIHYDWPYATGTEGYPALVVHGPLLASLIALDAERDVGELKRAEFRAQAPVFLDDIVEIFGGVSAPGQFNGLVRKADGTIAMSLVAEAN